jgi:hypothetical protein
MTVEYLLQGPSTNSPTHGPLLVLEQCLNSATADQKLHDVITQQVPAHKLNALLAILKRLVREKLSLTLHVGLLAFHLVSEAEK